MRAARIPALFLTATAILMAAPAAHAAITVGSSLSGPVDQTIGGDITAFQTGPTSLIAASPVTGTVVGGNVKQGPGGPASLWGTVYLRVVHDDGVGFHAVASGPANAIPAGAGTFPVTAHVPIAKGDLVAIRSVNNLSITANPGAEYGFVISSGNNFPDGGMPKGPSLGLADRELLYNAQIDPDNAFTVGAPTGGKKGTASVVVTVPNPGAIVAGSLNDSSLASAAKKKKKKAKPALTAVSATAADAGAVTLTLSASKVGRKVLRDKGKLKTSAKIVFTPTGGSASSQTIKLKLKR